LEQALSGINVLDLTSHVTGPYCTKLLADYGADVIKIEKPGEGDSTRRMGPFPGDLPHPEKSGFFLHLNTNKRSVTLNLKSRTGKEIFKQMTKRAEVVVESFRPGVMASFGLGYEVLEKINPRLVMASLSNFGQTGPYRDFRASDLVLGGMGGNQATSGVAEKEPLKNAGAVTQYMAGLYALSGIMGALYFSRRQGTGQYLDLSLMELLASYGDNRGPSQVRYQFTGIVETRRPQVGRLTADLPSGVYPCKDGYMEWFGTSRWRQAATMIGRPDLLTDPRYATPEARAENMEEVNAILLSWMMERTKEECWREALAADMICAPLNTTEELFHDQHVRGRGFWAEVEHPALGRTGIPGRPFVMNESPWLLRRPAPLLGEHNAEVLGELGYSGEDLVRLRQGGVV